MVGVGFKVGFGVTVGFGDGVAVGKGVGDSTGEGIVVISAANTVGFFIILLFTHPAPDHPNTAAKARIIQPGFICITPILPDFQLPDKITVHRYVKTL
jgi:hypothetical protein